MSSAIDGGDPLIVQVLARRCVPVTGLVRSVGEDEMQAATQAAIMASSSFSSPSSYSAACRLGVLRSRASFKISTILPPRSPSRKARNFGSTLFLSCALNFAGVSFLSFRYRATNCESTRPRLKKHENPPPAVGGELGPGGPVARSTFSYGRPLPVVDHRGHPVSDFAAHIDRMVGPVEPLKRPLTRGPMIAGLGFVLCEPDTVLDGVHLFSRIGFTGPLQQEPATPWNELARSPRDKRVVAVGVDGDLDACIHQLIPFEKKCVGQPANVKWSYFNSRDHDEAVTAR